VSLLLLTIYKEKKKIKKNPRKKIQGSQIRWLVTVSVAITNSIDPAGEPRAGSSAFPAYNLRDARGWHCCPSPSAACMHGLRHSVAVVSFLAGLTMRLIGVAHALFALLVVGYRYGAEPASAKRAYPQSVYDDGDSAITSAVYPAVCEYDELTVTGARRTTHSDQKSTSRANPMIQWLDHRCKLPGGCSFRWPLKKRPLKKTTLTGEGLGREFRSSSDLQV